MDHTPFAGSERTPSRHDPSAGHPYLSDFHLPLLDNGATQKTATIHFKHLSDHSADSDREHSSKPLQDQTCWTPLPLRRHVLLGFITVFASLLVALAVLFSYSWSHQGLSTADEHLYYIWTYGPTAVLSIISAFWIQVVYRTKQLMPWKAMAVSAQSASKSILLDYISPVAPVPLWRAVSNSHLAVVLSILSSFIIIALTVASTGLFVLAYVDVTTHDVQLLKTNKFSFDNFDWASTDVRPAGVVYATRQLGLKYPAGTSAQYAVQDLSAPRRPNATLTAVVDVFSAHLECEPADLHLTSVKPWAPYAPLFHSGATFNTKISTTDCTVAQFDINTPTILDSNNPINYTEKFVFGYGQLGTCLEDSSERVVVSAGTYIVHEKWNGTENDYPIGLALPYNKMFQIINSTNILCKPHHSIQPARVVKRSQSHVARPSQVEILHRIGHIGSTAHGNQTPDVARAVFQSVSDATTQGYFLNGTLLSYNTFFNILQSNGPVLDTESGGRFWQQHDNLVRESSALYQSVAAQVAAIKLLAPANQTVLGQMMENKPRLLMRTLSFGLMEAGFVSLIAISAYFFASNTKSGLSLDPGSINGLAIILGKSSEVVRELDGKEYYQMDRLRSTLKNQTYQIGLYGEIMNHLNTEIAAGENDKESRDGIRGHSSSNATWKPFVLGIPTRFAIVLCTLIFIIVLEILLASSQSRRGLVAIDTNSWLHYGWTYIPALFMILLRLTYDAANFSVKMINPYMQMHRGPVPGHISIQDHSLSRSSLHELIVSGKRGQVAVLFTTIAALLASILPIAVSGLYTAFIPGQDIKVHQLTAWEFNLYGFPNYTTVNETFVSVNQSYPWDDSNSLPLVTSLITSTDVSYPSWTYAGLALPLINASATESQSAYGSDLMTGELNVTLPAIRGSLNCSAVSHDMVEITYPSTKDNYQAPSMFGNRRCLNVTYPGAIEETYYPNMDCRIARISMRSGSSLDGCSLDPVVIFLPSHGEDPQHFGFVSGSVLMNHTYCPIVVGMFGTLTTNSIEDYTWFGCSTEVERVDTRTTFTLPDYTISSAIPDEATARHVDATAYYASLYRSDDDDDFPATINFTGPNAALVSALTNAKPDSYLNFFNMTDGQNYDNFFSTLVYGRNAVAPSEILGEANVSRLFAAVQHLWRLVIAQQFRTSDAWMTVSPHVVGEWAPNGPWNGTLTNPSAYRLQQNVVSTRILQGILAALALCAIAAFTSFGSTSRLLPNNPSSIAVVGSLLAGSEILHIIKKRQVNEEMQEDRGENPWAGYLFSLGWWNRLDGGRRFGIDIGRANPVEWPLSDKPRQRFGLRLGPRKSERQRSLLIRRSSTPKG